MYNVNLFLISDNLEYAGRIEQFTQGLNWNLITHINGPHKSPLQLDLQSSVDIILIDINSKDDLLSKATMEDIKRRNLPIIFLSNLDDPVIYDHLKWTMPVAYLVKPIHQLTFQSTIESVLGYRQQTALAPGFLTTWERAKTLAEHVFIKNNKNKYIKLYLPNIQAIEAEGNYCLIYTEHKKHAVKISLKKLRQQLPPKIFMQIHRKFIVQIPHIDSIDFPGGSLYIGERKFPLGVSYKNKIQGMIHQLK